MKNYSHYTFYKQQELIRTLICAYFPIIKILLEQGYSWYDICAGLGLFLGTVNEGINRTAISIQNSIVDSTEVLFPGSGTVAPAVFDSIGLKFTSYMYEPDGFSYGLLVKAVDAYKKAVDTLGTFYTSNSSALDAVPLVRVEPKAEHGTLYVDSNNGTPFEAAVQAAVENPKLDILFHVSGRSWKRQNNRGVQGYDMFKYVSRFPHEYIWITQPVGTEQWVKLMSSNKPTSMKAAGFIQLKTDEGRYRFDSFYMSKAEKAAVGMSEEVNRGSVRIEDGYLNPGRKTLAESIKAIKEITQGHVDTALQVLA